MAHLGRGFHHHRVWGIPPAFSVMYQHRRRNLHGNTCGPDFILRIRVAPDGIRLYQFLCDTVPGIAFAFQAAQIPQCLPCSTFIRKARSQLLLKAYMHSDCVQVPVHVTKQSYMCQGMFE